MPVIKILEDRIKQECISCEKTHDIPFSDITVGVVREDQIDGKLIQLPACKRCGAQEFLIRSSDNEPEHSNPGSFGHLHRLLVDILHSKLVEKGNIIPDIDPQSLLNNNPISELVSRYFGETLKIERPHRS